LKSARSAAVRFHKAGNGAGQKQERKADMAKRIKTYRVEYAVTRTEFYDIDARNERDAEERAFEEGTLVKEGDTTDVVFCWIERRPASVAGAKRGGR
jgi:hypothetical protein